MPIPGPADLTLRIDELAGARRARRRMPTTATRAVAAVVAVALFVGLVVLLFAVSVRAVPGNSDGATVVLEGQAIASGHLTLHGWYLSYDSFWGSDALLYAVAYALAGIRASLLNLVPAIIAAGIVVLGAYAVRDGQRRAPAVAAVVTVLALLALPSYALANFYLQGPLHVGTALWCLGAFVLLRYGGSRWRWALAVVLLAAAIDGDLQAAALGVAAVGTGGLVAMARQRDWRAGVEEVAAAVASVVLALVVREIAKLVGTFVVNQAGPTATRHQMRTNLGTAFHYLAKMLGFGSSGFGSGGVPGALAAVHVVAVVLAAAGVLAALYELVRGVVTGDARGESGRATWRLDDMLVVAFFASIAVFVYLTPTTNVSYARYLTPAVVFGALLAARFVVRVASGLPSGWLARAAGAAGVVVVGCFCASMGYQLAQQPKQRPSQQLGRYLYEHHLTLGVGDYWSSSVVTVESSDRVQVRPVTALRGTGQTGPITSYTRNSSKAWYEGKKFQFLVYNPALPFGNVDLATATATFGKPKHVEAVEGYLVLTWGTSHPITVPLGAAGT